MFLHGASPILVNGTAIHLVVLVGNVFFSWFFPLHFLHLNHHTTVLIPTPERTSHQLFPLAILQGSPDWLPFLPVRLPATKMRSRLSQRCADLLRPRSGSLWVRITAERLTFHDLTALPSIISSHSILSPHLPLSGHSGLLPNTPSSFPPCIL